MPSPLGVQDTLCPHCGSAGCGQGEVCESCGGDLGAACPACGAISPGSSRFCGQCGASLTPAAGTSGAERRQTTTLIIGTVAAPSSRGDLDRATLADLAGAARMLVGETVVPFGGHAVLPAADDTLARFDFRRAQDNDAQRAVRAGLAVLDAVRSKTADFAARFGVPLRVRIGIHTARADVGSGAEAAARVAARLRDLAEPGGMMICALTASLGDASARIEPHGTLSVEGVEHPIEAFRVRPAPRDAAPRFLHRAATRMFGREAELGRLGHAWAMTRGGQGRVVFLSGGSGIGKSRLLHHWRDDIGEGPARWTEMAGSPLDESSPFAPVVAMIHAMLSRAGEAGDVAGAIDALGFLSGGRSEAEAVVAELLGLRSRHASAIAGWTPAARRRALFAALSRWLAPADGERPRIILAEDHHWFDPSSREWLDRLVREVAGRHVMLIVTSQASLPTAWRAHVHVDEIRLGPLASAAVNDMIEVMRGGSAIGAAVKDMLVRRTEGIPLLAEELTRGVVDRAMERSADRRPEVPETLRDAVMARLDQTPSRRALLQTASVIGRSFTAGELAELTDAMSPTVEADLAALVEDGLVESQSGGSDRRYRFHHALVRDTAYETLPLGARRGLHARYAALMVRRADRLEDRPEIVGFHWAQAHDPQQAWQCFRAAGTAALQRGALIEAMRHFDDALDQAHLMHDAMEIQKAKFAVDLSRGGLLVLLKGYAAPDVEQCFASTAQLAQAVADDRELFASLWGQGSFYLARGPFGRAGDIGRQMLDVAALTDDPLLRGEAHRLCALAQFVQGDMRAAETRYAQAFDIFDRLDPGIGLYNIRPAILARALRAWLLWFLGRPNLALDEVRLAEQQARAVGDPHSRATALGIEASLGHLRQDPAMAALAGESCARIAREQSFPYWEAWGDIFAGWAMAVQGDDGGVDRLRRGWDAYRATGAFQLDLYARTLLADVLWRRGRAEGALDVLDFDHVGSTTAAPYALAEAYLTRGRVHVALGQEAEGATDLAMGLATARRQGSIMMERRAGLYFRHRRQAPRIHDGGSSFDLLVKELSKP